MDAQVFALIELRFTNGAHGQDFANCHLNPDYDKRKKSSNGVYDPAEARDRKKWQWKSLSILEWDVSKVKGFDGTLVNALWSSIVTCNQARGQEPNGNIAFSYLPKEKKAIISL